MGDGGFQCIHCKAYFWLNEAINKRTSINAPIIYTGCCQHGQVKLKQSKSTPNYLQQLLDPNNGQESLNFRNNIRVYNSMFAFTSMGAKIDKDINNGGGPYVFKICGQVHHLMGSVLPPKGDAPKYAQLYVYDTQNEISNRINAIDPSNSDKKIKPEIVKGLIHMFDEVNELTKSFRTVRDKFEDNSLPSFHMTVINRQPTDSKQYELPTGDQIGGLIVGDIGEFNSNKDIIIESNDGHFKRISKIHPKYMSLQYPLLFPYGEDGYRIDLLLEPTTKSKESKRKRMSMRSFVTYYIHDRDKTADTLLKGGRLFQQYLVDAYATVEENELDYIRNNQHIFRTEKRDELYNAFLDGAKEGHEVGQRIYLPSSYTGSPRDMINNYQDAMAICRYYGNPDLFITFTCNVNWPEILRYFTDHPGYRQEDRPDIICRIFQLKLEDMIMYIKSGQPFGKVQANVHTIEFQKRGLPHAHMLFWLEKDYKCYNPNDIDSIISAELPDQNINPELFKIVSQFMIHGPCGEIETKAPCMRDGKCSKFFPKPYNTDTTFERIKPPVYKRRDDETRFVIKDGIRVGNEFVVPYNSNLLLRYNAHINVESCSQSMLIKYLFKYINKGPDRARVALYENNKDEIQSYLNCRYLTPHESIWRLFKYSIHSKYPAVQRLEVHLPFEENVVFKENDCLESIIKNKANDYTTLTAWFQTNSMFEKNETHAEARELTYAQFPTKFVWNKNTKTWTPRQQYKTIGRIAYVHPMKGELYFLRMLLNIQKGCKDFNSVKTINGITYSTYKEACQALGLLGDDKEWTDALTESSFVATASEMRQLFATILIFCEVANPQKLFDTHWLSMCEDTIHNTRLELKTLDLNIPEPELKNNLLYELESILNMSSKSLQDYQLPMPDENKIIELKNKLLREEFNYDIQLLKHNHENFVTQLNACQRNVYDHVTKAIEQKKPIMFFVHGSGGTGKTFLWHTIINKLRSEGKIVLAVASSGIASLLLPNGRTAHSRFKIPLSVDDYTTCPIKKGTHLAKLLEKTDLILWDEAPMCNKYCFESLDKSLSDILSNPDITQSNTPFGGKSILLGGDFRQILPVVPGGTKEDIIKASLNNSYLWKSFKVFNLTENMRLSKKGLTKTEKEEISDFANWILQVGEGHVQSYYHTDDKDASWIEIPNSLLINSYSDPIEAIFNATYPDFITYYNNINYLKERAIVTPRNSTVQNINNYAINILPGDLTTYYSFDTISPDSSNNEYINLLYPTEFLNQLEFNGLPSHKLTLKVGMPIILLRNINQTNGLCNGTRLLITKLYDRLIEAKILTGNNIGQRFFIPRITLTATEHKWPFTFKRRQFPVRPCYAMTINKSQGQSLNQVGLFLSEPIFTHGQLYVALSRATSKDHLKIMINNNNNIPNAYTKNIVFKDILNKL